MICENIICAAVCDAFNFKCTHSSVFTSGIMDFTVVYYGALSHLLQILVL